MGRALSDKERISVLIEKASLNLIDFYAEKLHRSRAEVVRALVNCGLECKETMNSIGVYRIEPLRERGVIPQLPLGHYE